MRPIRVVVLAVVALSLAGTPAYAQDPPLPETEGVVSLGPDKKRLRFPYGPIHVQPGQNTIMAGPVTFEKPAYDGYVTRFRADLVRADGSVPPVDEIHLHHGVWFNLSGTDLTAPDFPGQRIAATGEEKTIVDFPDPYGYLLRATDALVFNHMIHNQTAEAEEVWAILELDLVAKDSPTGRRMREAHPAWMDARNGEVYPVYDVRRNSGGGDGQHTYPEEAGNPYGNGPRLNEWIVPEDGALVWNTGHLHPGGINTELFVERDGRRQLLFRSEATYFNGREPVSWDMAMTVTPPDWRVGLRAGDKVTISSTYDTTRAAWYEVMGISIAFFAPGESAPDPFEDPPQTTGELTHGSLPESANFGGEDTGLPDPSTLPPGSAFANTVGIAGFLYAPGNMGTFGPMANPPTVLKGQEVIFRNLDAAANIPHTITACRAPCNRSTGIGYPLADADVQFDSGQLGYGPPGLTAAANRETWALDTDDLDSGTYTYFCRVHPFMRGAFRVR